MIQYYLTVIRDSKDLIRRMVFNDYAAAVAYTARYYKPKAPRSVLRFTTKVINGVFARSFGTLTDPDGIDTASTYSAERYAVAAKQTNAFEFDGSYLFLIESEFGMREGDEDLAGDAE